MIGFAYRHRDFEEGERVKFMRFGLLLTGRVLEQNDESVRIALEQPVVVVTKTMRRKWFGQDEKISEVAELLPEVVLTSHYVHPIDAEM